MSMHACMVICPYKSSVDTVHTISYPKMFHCCIYTLKNKKRFQLFPVFNSSIEFTKCISLEYNLSSIVKIKSPNFLFPKRNIIL